MTPFVVKANNRIKAGPQRDAVNEVMNSEMQSDGTFDFDDMIKTHPNEFYVVLSLVYYQITKDKSKIAPPEINVKASKKYELMFDQMEKPILYAIKRAIESGEHHNILYMYKVKSFFMIRGVFADLPENLKEKAIRATKTVHGSDYDTSALENNEVNLDAILGTGNHSIMHFSITTFEFREP